VAAVTGLVHVRDRVDLVADAAAAFVRADSQVRAEFGRELDVNRTSTPWDVQLGMFYAWNRYVASGYKSGLYPGHSKAVHPSESFHVFNPDTGRGGNALDSDDWVDGRIVQILADNGFIRNRLSVPNEQHHFEWLRDHDRNYGSPVSSGAGAQPFPEEDMANVSDEEKQIMLEGARNANRLAAIVGGSVGSDGKAKGTSAMTLLRGLRNSVSSVASTASATRSVLGGSTVDRDGDGRQDEPGVIARLRTLLGVVEQIAEKSGVDFDYESFAAELAPYLELRSLSDGDLGHIATAVTDEQDRRARERLGE
jgi:hypothetical protein